MTILRPKKEKRERQHFLAPLIRSLVPMCSLLAYLTLILKTPPPTVDDKIKPLVNPNSSLFFRCRVYSCCHFRLKQEIHNANRLIN